MFNEGVDIASLDMVMFLRPKESPTVFLQQLGRGLRISKGKEYVNVLDFIGNYEKAGRAPFLLNGGACIGERTAYDYSEIEYPDDCIETTDMQKVYKMPILYGFYNEGDVRLAVTDAEVVESWKKFFDRGTNWKDFPKVTSYEEYRKITDKQHLSKAKSMPIKFLKASGQGFFIDKDGYALGIRDELADVIKVDAFKKQMKDIIEYRTMEYYRKRYVEN